MSKFRIKLLTQHHITKYGNTPGECFAFKQHSLSGSYTIL